MATETKLAERPIEDITRLKIVVGFVQKVWEHPEADKLYCEEVDVGEEEPRKIASGLRLAMPRESLEGQKVCVLANMKPKNLRGFASHGMLLCGSNETTIELVRPPPDAQIGEVIKFEDIETAEPDKVMSTKTGKDPFTAVAKDLRTNDDKVACYKNSRFLTSAGPCFCDTIAGDHEISRYNSRMKVSNRPPSMSTFEIDVLSKLMMADAESDYSLVVQYGTAGARYNAKEMENIMRRLALALVLYWIDCHLSQRAKYVGIMITASHNPIQDNGIKIIAPDAGMMDKVWEHYLMKIINCVANIDCENGDYTKRLAKLMKTMKQDNLTLGFIDSACEPELDNDQYNHIPRIAVGYDNRPSSIILYQIFKQAVEIVGGKIVDVGLITTPLCYSFVHWKNHSAVSCEEEEDQNRVFKDHFFNLLKQKLAELVDLLKIQKNSEKTLVVDFANGVASYDINRLNSLFQDNLGVKIEPINHEHPEALNYHCGADYIYQETNFPSNLSAPLFPNNHYCSFDGDADRLVYFFQDQKDHSCKVLGGEYITLLYLLCLDSLLQPLLQDIRNHDMRSPTLKLAIVQTAYANGACVRVIKQKLKDMENDYNESGQYKRLETSFITTRTGVRNLLEASKGYDIAVFFEPNGHGSISIIEKSLSHWGTLNGVNLLPEYRALVLFLYLHSFSIGDAYSNLLTIEIALRQLKLTVEQWFSLCKPLYSKQHAYSMSRENLAQLVSSPEDEQILMKPKPLQERIETITLKYKTNEARVFLRPSGTEPVCRAYVEASTEGVVLAILCEIDILLEDFFTKIF